MSSDDFKKSSTRNGQNPVDIKYSNPWDQVQDQTTAYNLLVSGLGMRMRHYCYTPYVIGATETGSLRNYDEQAVDKKNDKYIYDNNGMYYYAGDVYAIWSSNSKQLTQIAPGYYPDSSASVTVNRHYIDSTKIVGLSEFDKLVPVLDPKEDPLEYASVNWEQVKHNPVGTDRLMFHAVAVDSLIDANGIEYTEGVDFVIEEGNIKWGPKRPGLDVLSGEGVILSIRYRYVPSFYIKYCAHELRSHVTINPNTQTRTMTRLPMSAQIVIDWVFLQSLKNQEKGGDSSQNAGTGGNVGIR